MTIDHSITVSEALPIDRTERLAHPRDSRELAGRMAKALKQPDRRVAEGGREMWAAPNCRAAGDA